MRQSFWSRNHANFSRTTGDFGGTYETSSLPSEIAAQTGFCSASHLGARLTAATGHSSKHFRP